MNIDCVDIQNFRKLKKCRIDFSKEETILVGPNNSGKTTAMDALIRFLKKKKFSSRDFTLTNWLEINAIGNLWISEPELSKLDFTIEKWIDNLPSLDIWFHVEQNEIHHVINLIPTLDWDGGFLGVRLRFEPNYIEQVYEEFMFSYSNSKSITGDEENDFKLWPNDLWDFLDKKGNLNKLFSIKTYLLNSELKDSTQELLKDNIPTETDIVSGLIKVDIINAQRGFSDINVDADDTSSIKNLSSQLREYYDRHLNPSENPTTDDLKALNAIQQAKQLFEDNLQESFKPSLDELQMLNYPGFGNPTINLSSKFNTVDTLNHDSAVQYNLCTENPNLTLPEKYNGLGYQNLISMIFKLIRFRDEWMQVGKNHNTGTVVNSGEFEPLHLVLIEEPEAHLHAQVQQVFIKEAYKVLRNHKDLKIGNFKTQLLISTHSNHIAHEINFTSLRYFKRIKGNSGSINLSEVVNLSETFGTTDDSTKFAIRYLKANHSDLFFADAVILVEGPVERMLVPHFINKNHKNLTSCYISILEIGGSHAHTLKPLIENLGILTLIITDLDSVDPSRNNAKTLPEKAKKYKTGNDTLKKWFPIKTELDDLFKLSSTEKEHTIYPIKVAYQIPLQINNGKMDVEVYPYTFEDSLVMENKLIFEKISKATGLLAKMIDASKIEDINVSAKKMYEVITEKGAKKAEFALELLYFQEPNDLITPEYIKQGLDWLETKLVGKKDGLTV
ncbi:ATP-dependent endonuclease [Flavobacterium sp. KMS]|uniref:AAA family ATPase n=1 Tax=Flavobacterium sp. KMS TaxID=1566023 RepID=UPI00057DA2A5|nr:AAA family ATPase [Flavobacterium sp. KMS]KIA94491.1 ATP-dependent endonuclease [Flavobacterium sp. KMS]